MYFYLLAYSTVEYSLRHTPVLTLRPGTVTTHHTSMSSGGSAPSTLSHLTTWTPQSSPFSRRHRFSREQPLLISSFSHPAGPSMSILFDHPTITATVWASLWDWSVESTRPKRAVLFRAAPHYTQWWPHMGLMQVALIRHRTQIKRFANFIKLALNRNLSLSSLAKDN